MPSAQYFGGRYFQALSFAYLEFNFSVGGICRGEWLLTTLDLIDTVFFNLFF